MSTSPYHLAENVFFCLSRNRIVFLDLRRNKYLCLNEINSHAVIGLFAGSLRPGEKLATNKSAADDENARRVVQALLDGGLLTHERRDGNVPASVCARAPTNVFIPEGERSKPTPRLRHWVVFLRASLVASWKLRRYSMQETVRSIERRKQRRIKLQTTDDDALRELVATFHYLRPYYLREYLCLYDSLALVEFLAYFNFFPQWVFGVTSQPFSAHCWVQQSDYVLNDRVEYVHGFTPIMVV